MRRGDAGVELHVRPQGEPVGDMVGVAQDIRLDGIALRPLPVLLQGVVELVGIEHALDVAARAGIAVPVPGAADPAAGFVDPRAKAGATQPVQQIHAGEAGADDNGV